jgi:hypothetical protein
MNDTPKPRGRAIVWTDDDLDAMTTPEELAKHAGEAAQAFRDMAPPEFADLLDAETDDAE